MHARKIARSRKYDAKALGGSCTGHEQKFRGVWGEMSCDFDTPRGNGSTCGPSHEAVTKMMRVPKADFYVAVGHKRQ